MQHDLQEVGDIEIRHTVTSMTCSRVYCRHVVYLCVPSIPFVPLICIFNAFKM